MEELSAMQQFLVWICAIVAPLYAYYSNRQGSITIRDPSGQRTTYSKTENSRGFWVSIGLMIFLGSISWLFILGAF